MASTSPAGFSSPDLGSGPLAPQHYRPPSAQELRSQAMHRLQIGVIGLASMLLLVTLANIIMDRARGNDEVGGQTPATAVSSATPGSMPPKEAGDPLADIGVVPDLPDDAASPSGSIPEKVP